MKKIKCEVIMDLDTGEYDIQFFNVTNPGSDMSRSKIADTLKKVSLDFYAKCFGRAEKNKVVKLN